MPTLTRRAVLGGGIAATLYAATRGRRGFAQDGPDKILWVQVFASGGWDPMLFCDPKFGPRTSNDGGFHSLDQLGSVAGIPYVDAYAQGYPSVRPVGTFFEEHGDRLLVFNGIDMSTNNHDVGARYAMSGSLLEGFPIFAAQVAGVLGPERVMPLVDVSGYDEAGGLVAPVRLDYIGVPKINQLADPNDPPSGLWSNEVGSTITASRYLEAGAYGQLQAAADARLDRVAASRNLPQHRRAVLAWQRARAAAPGLGELEIPTVGSDRLANWKALAGMGVKAFRDGLASAMTVAAAGPNLDNHGIPDYQHLEELGTALQVASHVANEADAQGVPCVVVMCSEFGRTPVREAPGSGHWPIGSLMVLQNEAVAGMDLLPRGMVIGGTTGTPDGPNDVATVLRARRIHPTTFAFDDAGITLSPAHICRALRRAAGIDGHATLAPFPLAIDGKDLDLG